MNNERLAEPLAGDILGSRPFGHVSRSLWLEGFVDAGSSSSDSRCP